jgi:Mn2+/Fe2+ NRAMP family transporter
MGYLIDLAAAIALIALLAVAASLAPSKKGLIIAVACLVAVIGGIVWYIGSSYLQRQQEQQKLESASSRP